MNIKIHACQIIGPAAAGSAGPVPTALRRHLATAKTITNVKHSSYWCQSSRQQLKPVVSIQRNVRNASDARDRTRKVRNQVRKERNRRSRRKRRNGQNARTEAMSIPALRTLRALDGD